MPAWPIVSLRGEWPDRSILALHLVSDGTAWDSVAKLRFVSIFAEMPLN